MSRPHVTITLGGSGQVVKRPIPDADATHSNYATPTDNRFSSRGRLRDNGDSTLYASEQKNKRLRRNDGDDDRQRISSIRIRRDDLRYKLMHKNSSRIHSAENNGIDLREKLSRTAKYPFRLDSPQQMPERRRIPPARSADDLHRLDSSSSSYSAWTLDSLRRISPDRSFVSRGFSPRNVSHLRSAPPMKSIDLAGSNLTTEGVARPTTFMAKDPSAFQAGKPTVPRPPANGMMPKPSFVSDEPATVSRLLHSLGLGKYSILFQAEEIDMTALKQMGDNDLKELGIPMGPRKKILLALLPPRSKSRQQREV